TKPTLSLQDLGDAATNARESSGKAAGASTNVLGSDGKPLTDTSGGDGTKTIGDQEAYNNSYPKGYNGKCAETNLCAAVATGVQNGTVQLPDGPIDIVVSQVRGLPPCLDCLGNAFL